MKMRPGLSLLAVMLALAHGGPFGQEPLVAQDPPAESSGDVTSARSAERCDQLPSPPGRARGIDDRCPPAGSSSGIAKGDFNADGFADLAVGIPDRNIAVGDEVVANGGAVAVIYGSADGLTTSGTAVPAAQLWSLVNTVGPARLPRTGDRFGAALASGDFNGDGFSDLAVGAPNRSLVLSGFFGPVEHTQSGAVVVIYGSAGGLTASSAAVPRPQYLDLTSGGLDCGGSACIPPAGAHFGASLAWGNFNGDSIGGNPIGDLAIGIPDAGYVRLFESPVPQAGAVWVVRGDPGIGLDRLSDTLLRGAHGRDPEVLANGRFGASLAGGDFLGNAVSGLAVGSPRRTLGSFRDGSCINACTADAGLVEVFHGLFSAGGGTRQIFSQEHSTMTSTLGGTAEAGDRFGSSLAAGNFNGDTRADLAIGVPFEGIGTRSSAGAVQVLHGSSAGLTATTQFWTLAAIEGSNQSAAQFGKALAAGDFNGDGRGDLAVGVPFKTVNGVNNAGQVNVIYGSAAGLSVTAGRAPQTWHQNSPGIENLTPATLVNLTSVEGDAFGASLSAWNFGNNREFGIDRPPTADLAIGIPFKDVADRSDAGAVLVVYGCFSCSPAGLVPFAQVWTHRSDGIPGDRATSDHFGAALY